LTAAVVALAATLTGLAPIASAGAERVPSFCKQGAATCRVEGLDLRAPADAFTRLSDLDRGNILGVAFLPDGQHVVVGSAPWDRGL
jgi:hypothetical protein